MRKHLARILLVFLLPAMPFMLVQAQSCGLTDTFVVAQNSSLSFDIAIADYFNDDLSDASQGLCRVELGFVHQFVENFEVTLTSPSGQSVSLIGPNSDDDFEFTFGAAWQIDFVNCATLPAPDPVFSPQWNNTQSESWVSFGQYFGSYHPYIGCLEDFNTGPINGNWTISLNNNPSNYIGAITFLNLIFCDSRGVECCFTSPGILLNDDITACTNADTLLITPLRNFPMGLADTVEFGYAYLISQDGIFTQLDSMLDFRDSLAGNYQICGFSYRRDELPNLPEPDNQLRIDDIRANLNGLTPWLCAALTMDCIDLTIVAPPDTTFLQERICLGDSIFMGLDTFLQTGEYIVDLPAYANCDSTVVLNLFVQNTQTNLLEAVICLGDSVVIGNSTYYSTGFYRDTLQSTELGCDSIIELSLIVLDPVFTTINPIICMGESLLIGDSLLQQTGVYDITLVSALGCDSIVTINLQVLNPQAVIENAIAIDCNNTAILLNANASVPLSELSFKWLDNEATELGTMPVLEVNSQGVYILEVRQLSGATTCLSRDTVVIDDIRVYPIADPGPDTTLTCTNPALLLGGTQTSMGDEFTYEWQIVNQGNFTTTPFNQQVEVDAAGVYQLIVSNTITGCVMTETVAVSIDQVLPVVNTGPGFELNCNILQDTLDGSASLTQAGFVLSWSGACIETLMEPGLALVDCPGEYTLDVFNPDNGCRTQNTVLVTQNIETPTALIAEADMLNCAQLNVLLDASPSSPATLLEYEWADPANNLFTGNQLLVNQPGDYELIVSRQDNFCRDTTTINLVQDTIRPIAHIETENVLNCRTPTTLLGGPMTSIGPVYTYQWLEDGVLINGIETDTFRVNILGTYSLIVQNTENGCRDTTSIDIIEDFLPPSVPQAGANQFLDCANELVQLKPDSTLFQNPVTFSWSGPCVIEPDDAWGVYVNCLGTYTLEVVNVGNGCSGTDDMQVNRTDNYSIAQLPDSLYLSCETGSVLISTEGSSIGVQRWFLNNEPLFLPSNPTVSQTGTYTLIMDNSLMSCSDTASVEVLMDCNIEAVVLLPAILSCNDQSVMLDASNSLGMGELTYQWSTTDMSCILGADNLPVIEVLCPGNYQVIVGNEVVGRYDTLTVSVLQNIALPIINAGENVALDCTQATATLQGSVEGDEADFTAVWTDANTDTLSQFFDYTTTAAGVYFFTVQNRINGCAFTDVLQVTLDTVTPGIAFGNEFFNCNEETFQLRAFVQPPNGNYTYQWTGAGIVEDADSLGVLINTIGLYTFTVRDEDNGCDSTASIEVLEQICEPCLQVGTIDTLDCQTDQVTLAAVFCMPCVGCTLQWSQDGEAIIGAVDLSLEVSEPGSYTLRAMNPEGFISDTTVVVFQTNEEPSFTLGPDLFIDCDSSSFTLLAQELTAVSPLQYEWFEQGEPAVVIGNEPQLTVNEPGTYRLQLTQVATACVATDIIVVGINQEEPTAEAGNDATITCANAAIVLDGSNSTLTGVSYQWTTSEAACITGEETLNPIVSCPGWYFLTVKREDNGCMKRDSVAVFIDESLPALIPLPSDTILNCDRPDITLLANIPQDGENYEFRWCPLNELNEEISFLCAYNNLENLVTEAGVYEFTVENINTGCSNSFQVNVAIDTLAPMVEAGEQDTLFCTLSSLDLQAVAEENATYNWSTTEDVLITNANTLTPTIFQPAWYILTVESNQNGCMAMDSVLVEKDEEAPTLNAGLDTLLNCRNTQIELMATGETASGQAEWLWTTPTGQIDYGANTPNAGISDTAWYFVQLTDPINGCQIMDTLLVNQDIRQPNAFIENMGNLQLNCFQDTLLINASLSSNATGLGLTFNWEILVAGSLFPDTESEQVMTNSVGLYQLLVEDVGNGCSDTLSFNVSADFEPPTLNMATPDTLSCLVESVQLSTNTPNSPEGFFFEWRNANQEVISNTQTATVSDGGWYELLLQSQANGCTTLTSVFVVSSEDLPTAIINPALPITCEQTTILLDGSGSSSGAAFTYQWQALDNNGLLGDGLSLQDSTSLTGRYQLTVLNTETGCQNTAEISVQQEGTPITGMDISILDPPCEGDVQGSISINSVSGGTPAYTYSLNDQELDNISFFDELPTGSYEVRVMDSKGCFLVETVTIFPSEGFSLELGDDEEIQLGDSLQLFPYFTRPVDSLIWYAPGLVRPIRGSRPYVKPFETQLIVLQAFDANGCWARDTIRIVVVNNRPGFIPSAFSPNGDGYNDFFTVYAGTDVIEVKTLKIFSRWGNLVFERNNFAPNDPLLGWDGRLNGGLLNSAVFVYYVELLYQDQWVEVVKGDVLLMR